MIVLRLILMLLAGGLVLLALLIFVMAYFLLRPPRMTDAKANWVLRRLTPADIGLNFAPLNFAIRDQQNNRALKIAAWWVAKNSSDKTVVLLHGYADAKVGALAWAPLFHELGCNLLIPDLRGHGESGGTISSGGYWERQDVGQIIDELRERYPRESQHVIVFGASLGATIAGALAAEREDIEAIVLDSPYIDFHRAASAHFDLLGIALRPLHVAALALAEKMAAADFSTINLIELLPKSHCPILMIQGQDDLLTPAEDQAKLQQALASRRDNSSYWILPHVPHLMALAADPEGYCQHLSDFLSQIENRKSKIENPPPLIPSSHPTQ